jgi:two-component system sensor histidine kinase and response regulator WspE
MSMLDLFHLEAEEQVRVLTEGLLELEHDATAGGPLEACMRAAHSLKGAARIVGLGAAVAVAHAMEDCLVGAQHGTISLSRGHIDLLLRGVDLLVRISTAPAVEAARWSQAAPEADAFGTELHALLNTSGGGTGEFRDNTPPPVAAQISITPAMIDEKAGVESKGRVLRVTAENLDRLMGLAGESLIESRWLKPFSASLLSFKRLHSDTARALDALRDALPVSALNERARSALARAHLCTLECRKLLNEHLAELDLFDSRSANLADRLYAKALDCRMRPLGDGVQALPRMVRDLSHALGKQARLDIVGTATPVDRDILEQLEAPLGHLLRNAVDHGLESPEQRRSAGKSPEGMIRLEARHSAGMLQIIIADDGAGIDLPKLRASVVQRNLATAEVAASLSEGELLEFLFLPGFSMKGSVTEISGRGVGLDVVRDMVRRVRGTVRISTQAGQGTRFHLQLPLTLSVVRTLLAEVGREIYAFPLAHIARTVRLDLERVEMLEGKQFFDFGGRPVSLVPMQKLLSGVSTAPLTRQIAVIVLEQKGSAYGLMVDRFLGERELVVQPLDVRLGKLKDIAAGALTEDGTPVLIVDVEDLIHSVDRLVAAGGLGRLSGTASTPRRRRKRVLVVEDSLTVRELQRKLLDSRGYEVEAAVDGMDGWNAVRSGKFDLVVTDVDMPRLDGIELVTLIRRDPDLRSLPVMIVSYKDREEDRRRGLEAGADYYLAKSGFHDEAMLQAVTDLIGEAAE